MSRASRHNQWLLLAVALLLLGALLVGLRLTEHQHYKAAEALRLQALARAVGENLHQQLQAVSNALVALRHDFPPVDDAAAVAAASHRLQVLSDAMPGARTLLMFDAQGRVLAASRAELMGRDFSEREYFRRPRAQPDSAKLYISAPFTTALGVYSINIVRVVIDATGEFAGIVTATLDPSYFEVVMRSVLYASDMATSLVHGDGMVVMHVPSGQVRTADAGRLTALHTLQNQALDIDGQLVVAVDRDLAGIDQPWWAQNRLYAGLFALFATTACLALRLLQRRRMAADTVLALQTAERRRAEEQRAARLAQRLQTSEAGLQESELRLSVVAEAAQLGVWVRNVVHGQLWASPHFRALYGFDATEPIDSPAVIQRIHPDDRSTVERVLQQAQHQAGAFEMEFRAVLPDGRRRWMSSSGHIEADAGGRPWLMRGVSIDVSLRKEAELALAQQRRKVRHLSRVAMLGELSGAIAHELNQPLTAVLSNGQAALRFIAQGDADPGELRGILHDIVDESKRAAEVIGRVRLLISDRDTRFQSVDVNALVLDIFKLLRADLLNLDVSVKTDLALDLPAVHADPVQLQQVLINLVRNACDAMTTGHDAAQTFQRLLVVRSECLADEAVQVSVIDQGPGIPANQIETVFEAFFTTKPQGLGLGLSICRTILRSHGGQLWAENHPQGGAAVCFSLPLRPPPPLPSPSPGFGPTQALPS